MVGDTSDELSSSARRHIMLDDSKALNYRLQQMTDLIDNQRVKQQLLKTATYASATNCIRLLLRPPYSCDPDFCSDSSAVAMNALSQAIDRGDYASASALAAFSTTSPEHQPIKPKHAFDRAAIVRFLVYACDFIYRHKEEERIYPYNTTGVQLITNLYQPSVNVFMSDVRCRSTLAILFELSLASPNLFDLQLWSLAGDLSGSIDEDGRTVLEHIHQCHSFPICLYRDPCHVIWDADALKGAARRWIVHRYYDRRSASLAPLRLDDQCRIQIRRHLVNTLSIPTTTRLNYIKCINALPVPEPLRDFLLYRELWPAVDRCIDMALTHIWAEEYKIRSAQIEKCHEKVLFVKTPLGTYNYHLKAWLMPPHGDINDPDLKPPAN